METKKKLRKDLARVAKATVLLDECVALLVDALPDDESMVKARIAGMRSQGPNVWDLPGE